MTDRFSQAQMSGKLRHVEVRVSKIFWRQHRGQRRLLSAVGSIQEGVSLLLEGRGPIPMQSTEDGWHELLSPIAKPGTKYRFLLQGAWK